MSLRHPLQIVQIKVNHPIYPKNMMRKEIDNGKHNNYWYCRWFRIGKTTVTNEIMKNLEGHSVALLAQDYYYKDQSHLTLKSVLKQIMTIPLHLTMIC